MIRRLIQVNSVTYLSKILCAKRDMLLNTVQCFELMQYRLLSHILNLLDYILRETTVCFVAFQEHYFKHNPRPPTKVVVVEFNV